MIITHPDALRRALLTFACTACLSAMPMLAQEPAPPPPAQQQAPERSHHHDGAEMQERQLEHLTKALSLSSDQVAQVKSIQASSHQQMEALHGSSDAAPADRHEKMMSIHQTEQNNIRAVLNDEQKTKFDAMQSRMREHHEEHMHGNPPPPPPSN